MDEPNVYTRTRSEGALISDATYNLIIGLVLGWGFLMNWLIVKYIDYLWLSSVDFRIFLFGYMASCFLGVYLFNKSIDPAISFIGYNFVVVPFGLVINLVIHDYDPALVNQAIQITGLVTMAMMILGSLYPRFFQNIFLTLVIALFSVTLIELVQIFVFQMHQNWIDWAVALIFCGYIGFDWGRANRIPKTIDNAVDSAAQIYMDIINLFLRILRILGRKKR